MSLLSDTEQFTTLLSILHRGGSYAYWWINPGKQSVWWATDSISAVPQDRKNIYFSIHPAHAIPTVRHNKEGQPYTPKPEHVRTMLHEVAAVNCLYGDFDAKDFGDDKDAALDHIEIGLTEIGVPSPSVIIDTGGGYQAYWLFAEPWLLATDNDHKAADALQKAWQKLTSSDNSVKDLSRVFRVVGTRNYKYDERPLVAFHWVDFNLRYTREALAAYLPDDEPPPAPAMPVVAPARVPQSDHLRRWVDRRIEIAAEGAFTAERGMGSDRRVQMGKLAGGVVHTGVYSEQEIIAKLLPYALQRSSDSPKETERNLWQGLTYGKASPLRVPVETFPTDQPLVIIDGVAHCPSCDTAVVRSQYDYPGTTTPGWYCPSCKGVMKWPADAYTPGVSDAKAAASDDTTAATKGVDTRRLTQSERIKAWLKAQGYRFRLNMAGSILECNGVPLEDFLAADIRMAYRDTERKNIGMLEDVWRSEARANAYHPIRDYLDTLVWDGKPHISKLATYLHSSDAPIVYADGTTRPTHGTYLYRWLIGAVGKVFDRRQNAMLVLGGPQGIGKSEFVRWLCSKLPEHYFEGQIQPGERDSLLRFATNFIWEVAELDATTRRADRSALKGALTTEWIVLRKAYGHFDTRAPAIASFIGTFNPDHAGFLDDPSGSRRFWITTLTHIDWAYQQQIDVDQVWAEAVAAYRRGVSWRLKPEEEAQRITLNEHHEVEDPMLAFLERFFVISPDVASRMSSADIILQLKDREAPLTYHNPRGLAMDIARALKKCGLAKVGAGATRVYQGIAPRVSDTENG